MAIIQYSETIIIPSLLEDDDTYLGMFLVDLEYTKPTLTILDVPEIGISSIQTEFKNSNKT